MKSFRIPIVLSVFLLSFGLLTLFMIAVSQTLAAPAQQSGVDAERPESQDAEIHTSSNPSAAPIVCNGGLIDFDTGIPGDWVVVNNVGGNPVEWTDVASSGEAANYTGGAGDAASASSDLQGGGSGMYDTELRTPPIDLSTAFTASLTYWANYQNFALVDFLDLDISTDSGATWTTLLSWNEDHGGFRASPGEFVTVDLSAYFGQTAILRWHYYDPGTSTAQDWYAQIDEVSLSCGSVPTNAMIQLNKTVGTDPGVCATTNEISVAEGTTVTYCYEVANTGGVTLTMHDLVDSELGVILDGISFSLVPFASAFLTQSATLMQTTVNTATWTATDGITTAVDIDTATVNVFTSAAYPVCADFESGSLPNFMFAETTSNGVANGRVAVTTAFPHTGSYAMDLDTDCDNCGGPTRQSATMLIDLAGQSGVVLDFWVFEHFDESNPEDGVFVSDDGGATWAEIQTLNGFPASYQQVVLDLDAAVAGVGMSYVNGFMIRFQSQDGATIPGSDGYSFDDICVGPAAPDIAVIPASLTSVQHPNVIVTESLTINNTGTTTLTWSIDEAPASCAALGDITWATVITPSGATSISGSDAVDVVFDSTGLSPTIVYTATLCVNSDDPDTPIVSVPLTLSAPGLLTAIPNSYDVTIGLGYSATLPLNLANIGGLDVQFEIVERNESMTTSLPLLGQFDEPSIYPVQAQDNSIAAGAYARSTVPAAPTLAAGDVLRSWSANLPQAWGVAFGVDSDDIWVSSPVPAWGGNGTFNQYDQNGIPGISHTYNWAPPSGPADATYNSNTGTYWVMNVDTGVANCIFEIDAIGGYTGNTICPGGGTGFATSQRGLAYDAVNDQYFAGGWNDSSVHRFLPDGTILESVNVGLAISGLAYNPETNYLFAMVNADPNPVYILDVADNYNILGQFNISQDFGAFSGSGLTIDCEGDLWAVDQILGNVYEIDSGESADGLCGDMIPWLHQYPLTGTVAISDNLDVDITFDATVVTQTGQYYGVMKIKDDTPNAPIQIPVTMTVITNPNFSVALAASISQTSDPGQTVTYTLWLTNTGNVIDSYTLSVSGNSWSTLLSEDQFTLQAGESAMLTAVISIPANAPGGTIDVATVTAASADASDSATLTTVTNEYLLYLPFVAKE